MKTKKGIMLGVFALTATFAITSCNSSADNLEEAQQDANEANEALNQANEDYLADIENYRTETNALIDVNDSLILDFKAKLRVAHKENDPAAKSEIEELEQKNNDMREKMRDYKGEGKDNWTIFKEEFSHDMDELGEALKGLTEKNAH